MDMHRLETGRAPRRFSADQLSAIRPYSWPFLWEEERGYTPVRLRRRIVAGLLLLALSISGDARAGEHRDYPTLLPEPPRPSVPPPPGYVRGRISWTEVGIDSVSFSRYRDPQIMRHRLYTLPAGSRLVDSPAGLPAPVVFYAFLGMSRDDAASAIWAVHRDVVDSDTYVGARDFLPGEPRTLILYPAHGETLVFYRSYLGRRREP